MRLIVWMSLRVRACVHLAVYVYVCMCVFVCVLYKLLHRCLLYTRTHFDNVQEIHGRANVSTR
jgi:hypothetical protein